MADDRLRAWEKLFGREDFAALEVLEFSPSYEECVERIKTSFDQAAGRL